MCITARGPRSSVDDALLSLSDMRRPSRGGGGWL
jgi:hypothetical protein